MAQVFLDMFGDQLATETGTVKTAEALQGKVVGIYFSAHWCPPCRGFTPVLAKAYTDALASKGLEVIFVSSDSDEASFKEYFAEMPWKALPYEDRTRKEALSKKFKVKGIPTFVLLDTDGSTITSDGRSAVAKDLAGERFPWRPEPPKPFHEVLGKDFVGQGNSKLGEEAVKGKVLGLYFSAHWCPPCRGFTPQLASWYKTVRSSLPDFEIVFLSSDRSQSDFDEYFAEMPWIAVPHSDRDRKDALSELFDVSGIPSFVIVDKDGMTITTSGRSIPARDPDGSQFPWYPSVVKDLAHELEGIQENPALVVCADGADEGVVKTLKAALEPVGKELQAKAKAGGDEFGIFLGDPKANQILNKIRGLTGQPTTLVKHEHPLVESSDRPPSWNCDGCGARGEKVSFYCSACDFDFCKDCNEKAGSQGPPLSGILLDLSNDAYFIASDVDFTSTESVRTFVDKFRSGALTMAEIKQ